MTINLILPYLLFDAWAQATDSFDDKIAHNNCGTAKKKKQQRTVQFK